MIKSIDLTNFRNHQRLKLTFDTNFIYITGPNGSGKTSILESIHYISMSKSHRTNNDLETIKHNELFSSIKLSTDKDDYSLVISEKGKIASINKKEIRKLSDFIGNLKVVMFAPEDLNLIKGSPSIRRNFMDLELMKTNKHYLINLSKYKAILKQRNALLKNLDFKSDQTFLNILGLQLYEVSKKIIDVRRKFIDKLNVYTKEIYKRFSDNKIEISYNPNMLEDALLDYFTKSQRNDILYKTTMAGPHKDDFTIMFNDQFAKTSSQGETRLVVIALKLGLLRVINENTDNDVVLLLDDVLSELDSNVQKQFLEELPKDIQVIMNSAIDIENKSIQIINLKEINTDER